jgi:hypothetical protein
MSFLQTTASYTKKHTGVILTSFINVMAQLQQTDGREHDRIKGGCDTKAVFILGLVCLSSSCLVVNLYGLCRPLVCGQPGFESASPNRGQAQSPDQATWDHLCRPHYPSGALPPVQLQRLLLSMNREPWQRCRKVMIRQVPQQALHMF